MTDHEFDRSLATWLDAAAPASPPPNLHADAIARAGRSRQRPRWLVAVRGRAFGSFTSAPAISRRAAWILVVLGLVVALLVGLIAVGVFRGAPLQPLLGRNGSIAYAVANADGSGLERAYVVSPDGASVVEIAQGACPRFSGDGRVLTWREGTFRSGNARVLVAAPDGTNEVAVPGLGDEEYSLSPDGTRVAWMKRLPPITTPTSDGGAIARSQTELWVTPVVGGPAARIVPAPDDTDLWLTSPTWSPDGQVIAFAVMQWVMSGDNGGSFRLAIDSVSVDGLQVRRMTSRIGTDVVGLSWSPDGYRLAYVGIPDGGPIPSLPAGPEAPESFYPPLDLFVVNADGSGDRNLTSTPLDETDPRWSPDGDRVAFRAFVPQAGHRLAVTEVDDPSRSWSQSPASAYAWSPDGTRFVYVRPSSLSRPGVVIETVDSAFSELPQALRAVETDFQADGFCPPSWQRLDP